MDYLIIESLFLSSFNLSISQIAIEENKYYPLFSLSQVLGYSSPYALIKLVDKRFITSLDELYGAYISVIQDSYSLQPLSFIQFKKELKNKIPLFKAPFLFTNKEGVQQILSRNTITCEKIKKEICDMLEIPSIIHLPPKEISFYSSLKSLLQCTNAEINRQVYIAGYYADIEVLGLNKPIIIEYDENNHKYYNKEKEELRENVLKSLGYSILRINDSLDPVSSASFIFKQLLKYGLVI